LLLSGLAASPAGACRITATRIDFGTYDPLRQEAVTAVGYVSFQCPVPATGIRIGLSAGQSGTPLARTLTRPGAPPVRYVLTLDAGQTQVWGDGFGGSTVYTLASAPANTEIRVPLYAAILGQDPPTTGGYTDTVHARLTWN
jgi:spore coat protein U-like protein